MVTNLSIVCPFVLVLVLHRALSPNHNPQFLFNVSLAIFSGLTIIFVYFDSSVREISRLRKYLWSTREGKVGQFGRFALSLLYRLSSFSLILFQNHPT